MAYEIDFIGIKEDSKDATAIAMRWKQPDGSYIIGVFDGGIEAYGEELKLILNNYYFQNGAKKVIDFVICSHPHDDHLPGLKTILENFQVNALYVNRPWQHIDELYEYIQNHNMKPDGLEKRLRENYSGLAELEELAANKGVPIYDIFQGACIEDKLTVLSPSKDFYLELLVESDKTPLKKKESVLEMASNFAKDIANKLKETWTKEELHEDVKTEPDNETSTVIIGEMDDEAFLLTGDVGIRGLRNALDYSSEIGITLHDEVSVFEMPHHGGRHNVSPSILNELLGGIVDEGYSNGKEALVCVGKNSDHPLQMVVNGFRRRGVKVYKTAGATLHHQKGNMPDRDGWVGVKEVAFNTVVEDWND